MAELKIRVSAAADPSLKTAFRPLEDAARRAGESVKRAATTSERAQRQAGKEGERAANQQAAAARRVEAELAKLAAREVAAASRAADAAVKAEQKKTSAAMREFDKRLRKAQQAYAEEERGIMRVAQAAERAEQKKANAAQRAARSGASGVMDGPSARKEFANRALHNTGAVARAGLSLGRDVARGIGVDFSVGGMMARNVELQRTATQLANQSQRGGGGVTREDVLERVKAGADLGGFSRLDAAKGVSEIANKTGDVELALALMGKLGPLAMATGTQLSDMSGAAGEVANAFDKMPKADKVKAVDDVMRALAAQSAEGAIEMPDMARGLAKLAATAPKYEGDRAGTLAELGAVAQMARARGGAASSREAFTSIANFQNTLQTSARRKAFKAQGVELENEQKQLRGPRELITESILAADDNTEAFKSMWANVQGARSVEGFRTEYMNARSGALNEGKTEAEAKEAGKKAIDAAFDKFGGATMSDATIAKAAGARAEDTDVKAQRFQNKLDEMGDRMGQKLIPALERMEPALLAIAEKLSTAIAWAADNMGKAAALAIGASIAKSGLETVVSNGIASLFQGGGAAGNGTSGAVAGGGMSNLAAGLTILGAAVTITATGVTLIDQGFKAAEKTEDDIRASLGKGAEDRANAVVAAGQGTLTSEQYKALQDESAQLKANIERGEAYAAKDGIMSRHAEGFSAAANWITAGSAGTSGDRIRQDRELAQKLDTMREEYARSVQAIQAVEAKLAAGLNVTVLNIGQGLVDQVGRTGGFVGSFFGG